MSDFFGAVLTGVAIVAALIGFESLFIYLSISGGWFANAIWMIGLGWGAAILVSALMYSWGDAVFIGALAFFGGLFLLWAFDALFANVFGIWLLDSFFDLIGAGNERSRAASGVRLSLFALLSAAIGLAVSSLLVRPRPAPQKAQNNDDQQSK